MNATIDLLKQGRRLPTFSCWFLFLPSKPHFLADKVLDVSVSHRITEPIVICKIFLREFAHGELDGKGIESFG